MHPPNAAVKANVSIPSPVKPLRCRSGIVNSDVAVLQCTAHVLHGFLHATLPLAVQVLQNSDTIAQEMGLVVAYGCFQDDLGVGNGPKSEEEGRIEVMFARTLQERKRTLEQTEMR